MTKPARSTTVGFVAMRAEDMSELDALVARGQELGWVEKSEIDSLATRQELDELVVEELRERLAAAGVEVSLEREHVRRVVAQMGEPARSVIRLRYGLDGDQEPQTYAAIGQQLGLCPERVREIEQRALRELATHRELEGLRAA